MTTSISRCCKWHFFPCLSMWNNWIAASCPWPAYPGPCQGHTSHQSLQVQKSESLGTLRGEWKRGEKAPHAGCLTNVWPRVFVLCSPLRYILVQFYQHFSPSFQSCWKQHFEWEDEVCPFSCMLSLTTLAPLCLPTYTPHLIQIENLSEGKREKRPAWAFFPCFPWNKSLGVLSSSG